MKIAILADDLQKKELAFENQAIEKIWADNFPAFIREDADVYFDYLFENSPERIEALEKLEGIVIINSVIDTLEEISSKNNFVRINGWNGFRNNSLKEIATTNEANAIQLFDALGWPFKIVPDIPGFLTPRVIAMIINEAYFTLEADVSTKEEIDIAMKLGTNYPYGPFEWSEKVGLKNIHQLLLKLSKTNRRYIPCDLLIKEAAF
ncbi:MAG TPA: 3-hydroxyacyl-CoA dehydrogenase family protein [Chitinophagaceae bacterium]|nr:3-hydroxyacyl-CoA dehydrogenase family protein [Chitinophagaceae bacterium]